MSKRKKKNKSSPQVETEQSFIQITEFNSQFKSDLKWCLKNDKKIRNKD
ncbi:hypothetical protein GM3708_3443 [Geminocystis sp. NIES-3708]|nr:hypothetical protein GM3708_3443 [Geminocystis sp. NIES-3708]